MFVRAIAHSWSYSNNIRIEYKNNQWIRKANSVGEPIKRK